MCEMNLEIIGLQNQLEECRLSQNEFKDVANNSVGQVGKEMVELDQNQNAQGKSRRRNKIKWPS